MNDTNSDNPAKKSLPIPNSLVFIFIFICIATLMTWIIPAGTYSRTFDSASGQNIVVADSFHYIAQNGITPARMFQLIGSAFIEQAPIIFFIMFAYAYVDSLVRSGVFDGLFSLIFKYRLHKKKWIIPVIMISFGLLGSVAGLAEETFGLFPVCISLALALGYDRIVGGSMIYLAIFTGFASATTNPFTIGVAQNIAQVPIFSGILYRIICFIVFMTILITYVMRYANKVLKDPTQSILYDDSDSVPTVYVTDYYQNNKPLTLSQKLNALLFLCVLSTIIVGSLKFGWYLTELTALFLFAFILSGIINKYSPNKMANEFITSASGTTFSMICVGFANAVAYILNAGNIIDTILHRMSILLNHTSGYVSGLLMLIMQNLLNFFVPAGPAQAAISMPIMAPLADLCGLSRQLAILAFQFGDGYSNLFWPTMVCMMCGMMKIPITKWYKYITPLFGLYFLAQVIMICIAIAIGY